MTKEAIEKIYLFENPVTKAPDDRWLSTRSDDADIEYIRTDVLIDKACEWLEPVLKDLVDYNCAGDLIRDFKKVMEEKEK